MTADGGTAPVAGVSFDLWNTLVWSPSHDAPVRQRRVALLARTTGRTAAEVEVAFRSVQLPIDQSCTKDLSVESRLALALDQLDHRTTRTARLARDLSDLALGNPPEVVPGCRAALETLGASVTLTIVSNTGWTSGQTMRVILGQLGIGRCFAQMAFSDETGWAKPSATAFRAAWRGTSIPPRATVHVGDQVTRDVSGAHAFGALAVLCRVTSFCRKSGDQIADGVFYDYSGLPPIVELLAQRSLPDSWVQIGAGTPTLGTLVAARVTHIRSPRDAVPPGRVIILSRQWAGSVPSFRNTAAVLVEAGGPESHAAQLASAAHVPCVVGLQGLARSIEGEQLALIDSQSGQVFIKKHE